MFFLLSSPFLYLILSLNSIVYILMFLKVHQLIAIILFRKPTVFFVFVLLDSFVLITRHSCVECSSFASHYVDEELVIIRHV
jgi:hypothetical protein